MKPSPIPKGCPWWSESAMRHGLREHGSIETLATAWDVHQATLYKWQKRHGIDLEDP